MKNCKSCLNEINSEFVFCPLCGARADGNKECPKCKALSAEQNKFCPSCGYNFGAFAKQGQKSEVAVKPQPAEKKARRSFKQVLTSEKNGANFILNCAALVFAIATLFTLAFAPLIKIKLDFSNMPVQFSDTSKIELKANYIDTTSAVSKSLFYTKKNWQTNRTAEKFTNELELLLANIQSGYAVDLRPTQRSLSKLNLAELSVISSALTDEGIKTPSVFWMLATWSAITAAMVLDIILIVFLTMKIAKLDFRKYRSKLFAPLGILLFSMVFIFGKSSQYNFGFAAGKEIPLSTAIILPIVFLSILGFAFLLFDIIEKGFKKFGRYAFSLGGAVLALFLGLAGRGGIIKIRSEVKDKAYATSVAPSNIISVLDKVAEYSKLPRYGEAFDEFGADKIIAGFISSVQITDEVLPDLAKILHDEFTFKILSSNDFTLSEIDAFVMFSITSLLYFLSGVLPAMLLVFTLKRMTADDENIKMPFVLSIIAIGLYFALLTLDIITVIMLNDAFKYSVRMPSIYNIARPKFDIRAAITFNAIISLVLAMGLFVLYFVKNLIYKKRSLQLQESAATQQA